jgi:acyl-coenzyme A thioesterase PaaI-like protein
MAELDTDQLHRSPVHKGLGMSVVEYKPGFAILSMPLSEEVRGGYEGTIHGGILADSIIRASSPRETALIIAATS